MSSETAIRKRLILSLQGHKVLGEWNTKVLCSCDNTWRSHHEQTQHVAAALTPGIAKLVADAERTRPNNKHPSKGTAS